MTKLEENVVYEFQNSIPPGWHELSVRYETNAFGKRIAFITCISEKPKLRDLGNPCICERCQAEHYGGNYFLCPDCEHV
jgi:hypothetical protein